MLSLDNLGIVDRSRGYQKVQRRPSGLRGRKFFCRRARARLWDALNPGLACGEEANWDLLIPATAEVPPAIWEEIEVRGIMHQLNILKARLRALVRREAVIKDI